MFAYKGNTDIGFHNLALDPPFSSICFTGFFEIIFSLQTVSVGRRWMYLELGIQLDWCSGRFGAHSKSRVGCQMDGSVKKSGIQLDLSIDVDSWTCIQKVVVWKMCGEILSSWKNQ